MDTTRNRWYPQIKFAHKVIGHEAPTFFIAEIGNNHNGDYYLAKRLIEKSAEVGADAVKFQKRFIDQVFTREMRDRPQTKDQIFGKTYGEYRRALEFELEQFIKLKEFAESLGLIFFATPFDHQSVDFLEQVGVSLYKVSSFDVTNLPLLEKIARLGKPMILSTGMSSLEELDEAVGTIRQFNRQLVILHCIAKYPATDEHLNLLSIPFLRSRYYPIPVGYSGHEKDLAPTLASVALGAKCIERHFTLDKSLPGPDHATVSLNPEEFAQMIREGRRIEQTLGRPGKFLFDDELVTRHKHGKSLVTKIALPKNTVIIADMIICKSPGSGLKPSLLSKIVGKRTKIELPEDHLISFDDLVI